MNFARSLFTVSSLTILSRVAGFVRDTLTATFLGAGPIADAFFVAQRLPNLFRTLFAEGAFSSAFVPLYTTEHERHGIEAARKFAGEALALLLSVLIPFSALMMLFMPKVMLVLAPGFQDEPEKFNLAVDFSIIAFPYLALISVAALQSGVLNAHGKFGPGAAAPIALNLVLIIALFVAHHFNLHMGYTLAWALTISGIVQMVWLIVSCYRARVSIPIVFPRLTTAGKRLFQRIAPGAIGAGAGQINLLISTILASSLPTGAVSFLFYADRINQLPLGIVGIAVATTLLPLLSREVEAGKEDSVLHYTSRAIEFCLALGLPATIGLLFASEYIIQTLFEHGAFTHADTIATSQALTAYAIGIPAFLLVKVFTASFFARHNTVTPVKIAVISMVVNIVLSVALLGPLQHIGIALSNSAALWTNAILLLIGLKQRKIEIMDAKLRQRLPPLITSSLAMCAVTYGLVRYLSSWFVGEAAHEVLALAIIIGCSSLAYGVFLHISGAMRIHEVLAILKRKPRISPVSEE
ncbi:MAG: murein biosynthesis integral membrane protein MurJ [Alphaproteobacteria bacterium]